MNAPMWQDISVTEAIPLAEIDEVALKSNYAEASKQVAASADVSISYFTIITTLYQSYSIYLLGVCCESHCPNRSRDIHKLGQSFGSGSVIIYTT